MPLSAGSILCFPHKQETRNEANSCLKGASSAERKTVCKEPSTYRGKHPNISCWVQGFTEGEPQAVATIWRKERPFLSHELFEASQPHVAFEKQIPERKKKKYYKKLPNVNCSD